MVNFQDKKGIVILTILYFIQGLPIGLVGSTIPFLLMEKGVNYKELALLSFAFYPFSFKIFFAPFEDLYYSRSFGKRKTYIIPI